MYAVLHAPSYRSRYLGYLTRDFPHVPLTTDKKLFADLAYKGKELIGLHLLESPILLDFITDFPVKGSNIVEKLAYTEENNRVWINDTQFFGGVLLPVWNFEIGGYEICEKWLENRAGRELTYQEIQHYQKMIVAITETIRLMSEIDALTPGWPLP
jgi:Type ISP C-terminal specificity domain